MSINPPIDEPTIPPRLQRPLAAVWISLGLHVAVIALVHVAPPTATGLDGPVIEARLVSASHATVPDATTAPLPDPSPLLASSESAETLQVPAPPPPEPVPTDPQPAPLAVAQAPTTPPEAVPVAINSAVDLTFYGARDVDVHPRTISDIAQEYSPEADKLKLSSSDIVQEYPLEADKLKLSGKVLLQLKIEADGRVLDVVVVKSSPPDLFDEAAIKSLRSARFEPALKNGRPVRALMLIEVEFDWAGRLR